MARRYELSPSINEREKLFSNHMLQYQLPFFVYVMVQLAKEAYS